MISGVVKPWFDLRVVLLSPHIVMTMCCLVCAPALATGNSNTTESESKGPSDWIVLERQSRELPMEARRLTGPLFWLHGDESPEQLEAMLERVAESGNGCFTAESRPHADWLGPGWYRDLAICLEKAKALDLKMWIFDERWWPSQMVGGRVPPQYGSKTPEERSKRDRARPLRTEAGAVAHPSDTNRRGAMSNGLLDRVARATLLAFALLTAVDAQADENLAHLATASGPEKHPSMAVE